MSTSSAKLSVLVGKDFACLKIAGRANFSFSPDFKTLLTELSQKGYTRFVIDLLECVLMDSTFLGVLAGFGIKLNQAGAANQTRHRIAECQRARHRIARKSWRAASFQNHERRAALARQHSDLHARIHQPMHRKSPAPASKHTRPSCPSIRTMLRDSRMSPSSWPRI